MKTNEEKQVITVLIGEKFLSLSLCFYYMNKENWNWVRVHLLSAVVVISHISYLTDINAELEQSVVSN